MTIEASKKKTPNMYPNRPPNTDPVVAMRNILRYSSLFATTIGTIIKSGGTGKKKLSINATKPNKGFENLCLASSTHLSYNFFKIMNLKCTILRYLASLILSTVAIYSIVIVAGIFGADYGFSPEGTFIIWILMAILINQSVTWKK